MREDGDGMGWDRRDGNLLTKNIERSWVTSLIDENQGPNGNKGPETYKIMGWSN